MTTPLLMPLKRVNYNLTYMEPVIAQAMFESISLLSNACVNLRDKCVDGITVNKEVCEGYVFNSISIVTYLNPYIGHHEGEHRW
ncbi:hypothetical protein ACT691_00045 [Vibrio metschnikovii]